MSTNNNQTEGTKKSPVTKSNDSNSKSFKRNENKVNSNKIVNEKAGKKTLINKPSTAKVNNDKKLFGTKSFNIVNKHSIKEENEIPKYFQCNIACWNCSEKGEDEFETECIFCDTDAGYYPLEDNESQCFIYTKKVDDVLNELHTDKELGLTEDEAKNRLIKNGKNELQTNKKTNYFFCRLSQFNGEIINILLIYIETGFPNATGPCV